MAFRYNDSELQLTGDSQQDMRRACLKVTFYALRPHDVVHETARPLSRKLELNEWAMSVEEMKAPYTRFIASFSSNFGQTSKCARAQEIQSCGL